MLANPPFGVEWKQQKKYIDSEHERLGYKGRFGAGLPRINDGSLLFLQHMIAKMRPPKAGGSRIAIVFNGSPLFTGDAGSGAMGSGAGGACRSSGGGGTASGSGGGIGRADAGSGGGIFSATGAGISTGSGIDGV